jgi:hypothetical protein
MAEGLQAIAFLKENPVNSANRVLDAQGQTSLSTVLTVETDCPQNSSITQAFVCSVQAFVCFA